MEFVFIDLLAWVLDFWLELGWIVYEVFVREILVGDCGWFLVLFCTFLIITFVFGDDFKGGLCVGSRS